MSLSAVVQHVQILEVSSLARSEKVGRTRICRMDPEAFQTVERWVNDRRRAWDQHLDRLGAVLAAEDHDRTEKSHP